jgi:transposase
LSPSQRPARAAKAQDISEVLDVIPAILRVLRMIRPKYGCRDCEGAVVQAKAFPRLIENAWRRPPL